VYRLLGKRKITMNVDRGNLSRDLTFFLAFYIPAIATTFVHENIVFKSIVAIGLLLSYAIYLRWTVKSECEEIGQVDELYLTRFARIPNNRFWIIMQAVLSLVLLVAGAHIFIKYVQALSLSAGVSPLILSLLITPVATEMPEKLNSIIWIGKKKDTLALGNITGAMVFQSCFPVVFGMLFTQWDLRGVTLVSAALAIVSASIVLLWIRIRKTMNPFVLLSGGVFYAVLFVYILTRAA
jgi:cation:H+ antiporter